MRAPKGGAELGGSMDAANDDLNRIEALERHVAHQEATIADLDEMVTRQWTEIERLGRLIEQLSDRLAQAEYRASLGAPDEPPPPHY